MICFHASHEQFSPSKLLQLSIMAEKASFRGVLSSDHFHPWSNNQGQSGFAWSWLGAAMNATSFSFGVVNTPCYRYNPAVVAQASATLSEMFPDRFWLCVGSGELLNEGVTGERWPAKQERNQRLKESAELIRRLWNGETVSHHGLITVEKAHLFTRPEQTPLLMGAAITPQTAKWLGSWADGLVTVGSPKNLKEIIEAFKRGGGDKKPIYLKTEVSYSDEYEKALGGAFQHWKYSLLGSAASTMLRSPEMFDEVSKFMRPEDITEQVCISTDSEEHVQWLKQFLEMGVERIFVHNVNLEQERFIEFYKQNVLPSFNNC
jgi:coenzyme F420-dependent glucose-6-phosphate dehydrogenase